MLSYRSIEQVLILANQFNPFHWHCNWQCFLPFPMKLANSSNEWMTKWINLSILHITWNACQIYIRPKTIPIYSTFILHEPIYLAIKRTTVQNYTQIQIQIQILIQILILSLSPFQTRSPPSESWTKVQIN